MVNHFAAIGFVVNEKNHFLSLIDYAVSNGKSIKTEKGTYHLYNPCDKVELWILTEDKKLHDLCPFYDGYSNLRIQVENVTIKSERTAQVKCWVNPTEDLDGDCVFIIDVPDYWIYNHNVENRGIYNIKLTAFAEIADLYDNEKDFSENAPKNKEFKVNGKERVVNGKKIKPPTGYAPNYFIPTGTFSLNPKEKIFEPVAMFAGKIKKYRFIENNIGSGKFYWMLVETFFGELDIVSAETTFKKKPKIGGIIDGNFYLTGKFKVKNNPTKLQKFIKKFKK